MYFLFVLVFFSLFAALVSVALIGRNMHALDVGTCCTLNRGRSYSNRRKPNPRRVGSTARAHGGTGKAVVFGDRLITASVRLQWVDCTVSPVMRRIFDAMT